MSEQVTLAEAISSVIEASTAQVFCARPAKVTAYDATTQKVSVEVALAEAIETEDETVKAPIAEIVSVPVAFPRGGGFFVSFPIAVGDYVTLVFADRSIDLWLKNGGSNVDPIDLRRHSVGDAIAIPGCYPDPSALTEAHASKMTMGYDTGMQVSIDNSGAMVLAAVGAATQAIALATKVETELAKIETAHNTHTHVTTATVSAGSPGVLAAPGVSYTPGTVGSSKVTVEE